MRSVVLKSQFRRDFRKWIEGAAVETELRAVMERIAGGKPLEPRHRRSSAARRVARLPRLPRPGRRGVDLFAAPGLAVFHCVGSHSELFRR